MSNLSTVKNDYRYKDEAPREGQYQRQELTSMDKVSMVINADDKIPMDGGQGYWLAKPEVMYANKRVIIMFYKHGVVKLSYKYLPCRLCHTLALWSLISIC